MNERMKALVEAIKLHPHNHHGGLPHRSDCVICKEIEAADAEDDDFMPDEQVRLEALKLANALIVARMTSGKGATAYVNSKDVGDLANKYVDYILEGKDIGGY